MILHWLIESTVKYSKRVKVKTDGEKYTRNLLYIWKQNSKSPSKKITFKFLRARNIFN